MPQGGLNQTERADHAGDNPALSNVIERNIRTIIDLRRQAAQARGVQDRLADAITAFSGRMMFVYAHIAWFPGAGHGGVTDGRPVKTGPSR